MSIKKTRKLTPWISAIPILRIHVTFANPPTDRYCSALCTDMWARLLAHSQLADELKYHQGGSQLGCRVCPVAQIEPSQIFDEHSYAESGETQTFGNFDHSRSLFSFRAVSRSKFHLKFADKKIWKLRRFPIPRANIGPSSVQTLMRLSSFVTMSVKVEDNTHCAFIFTTSYFGSFTG